MEFGVDIKKLSNSDLIRYNDFLLDKLIGVVQSNHRRMKLLDRIDMVMEEFNARHDNHETQTDTSSSGAEDRSTPPVVHDHGRANQETSGAKRS